MTFDLHFSKMQALGNDYIYVELLTQRMENPSAWARFLSRRRFGVGSDGFCADVVGNEA